MQYLFLRKAFLGNIIKYFKKILFKNNFKHEYMHFKVIHYILLIFYELSIY